MLYCSECGQCFHLSNDNFFEIRDTSGWEKIEVHPENGETIDYLDSETTDSQHVSYECPYCNCEDIDADSNVTNEEAIEARELYDENIFRERETFRRITTELNKTKESTDPNREWDVISNVKQ